MPSLESAESFLRGERQRLPNRNESQASGMLSSIQTHEDQVARTHNTEKLYLEFFSYLKMKPFSQGDNVLCWGVSKCWLLWVAKRMSSDMYVYLPCGTCISVFTW